jgi:CRP/FNR family cyclic AMP-dependent transcriptional regulator
LWLLAERWGRVVPGGVLVSLRLPHRTLAGMVGARRPSVTTALGQLMARGAIERRPDGGWVLRGSAPAEGRLGVEDATTAMPFEQRRVGVPS